ncbi:UNVERIFIED_CONTAM: hypothetical protein Sangu_2885500 [Sesamum angustifolium]|uniref:Uncharacterized protein n=1 Tax=Sesamum angustifolium TaxID=2727405 RepID=A0AAW2IN27_9LAMI
MGTICGNTWAFTREMVNSDNGGDNRSYEGNSSFPVVVGPTTPPTNPTSGALMLLFQIRP